MEEAGSLGGGEGGGVCLVISGIVGAVLVVYARCASSIVSMLEFQGETDGVSDPGVCWISVVIFGGLYGSRSWDLGMLVVYEEVKQTALHSSRVEKDAIFLRVAPGADKLWKHMMAEARYRLACIFLRRLPLLP